MKIQENIDKILWTFADKLTYVVYGLVTLLQIRVMDPADFGLFSMIIGLHTWIFGVSDSFALNHIVQFGTFESDRPKVNLFSLSLHLTITIVSAILVFLLKDLLAVIFSEPRFVVIGYVLPVLTLLTIPRTYCIKIIFRERAYKRLFFVNLAFFGTMSLITAYLLVNKGKISFDNIVWLYYIGTFVSMLISILLTFKHLKFGTIGNVSFKKMLNFSLPITLYSALHGLPKNLDTYIIKLFFPLSTIGVYNSSKTLYRLFEEANNATIGLLYPVAVRQIEFKNHQNVNDLMTKAVSFILMPVVFMVAILELGLSEFLITTFLPYKYHLAVGHFNILLIAAIFLPFTVIPNIITAYGKPQIVLKYVAIAVSFSIATFFIVGYLHSEILIPLGIIVYTAILGILCFKYVNKNMGFKFASIFRIFSDTFNFIKKKR